MSINDNIINIKKNIDDLIKVYKSDSLKIEILNKFVENKISYYIDHQLKIEKKKRQDIKIIESQTEKILKVFKNIYFNSFLNYFYIYEKGNFKIISYDLILVKINTILNEKELSSYKKKININIKNSLKKKDFLNIIPDNNDIITIKNLFKNVFLNEEILKYFFYFIGSCLNGKDYELFSGNNIFFGVHAFDLIECLKYYIYDISKLYIRSLSDIKTRYNNYDFQTCFLFKISIHNFNTFKNNLKKKKELFCVICNYFYNNNSFIQNNLELNHIFKLNYYSNKLLFFKKYLDENTIIDKNEEVKIQDLYIDFNNFLQNENLPTNLLSNKEIFNLMNENYFNLLKRKYIFMLSLNNYNKKKIFEEFFKENIIYEDNNLLNLNQIEYFYKKWFKIKNSNYSVLTKNEIRKYIQNINNLDIKDSFYINIKLINFDKKNIFNIFYSQKIQKSKDDTIFLLDIKNSFDLWFRNNDNNYPEIGLNELKYYFTLILEEFNQSIFGWSGYKLI